MLTLTITGGIFVAAALIVRESQHHIHRRQTKEALNDLTDDIRFTQEELRCTLEDLYVLRTVLAERDVVDEIELSQNRQRLLQETRQTPRESGELPLLIEDLSDDEGQVHILTEANTKIH